MNEETKARLREINAKRRGTLLKDHDELSIHVACDHAEEAGLLVPWRGLLNSSYLKYASKAQIAALRRRLPHARGFRWDPGTQAWDKETYFFDTKAIKHILAFLTGPNATKYRGDTTVAIKVTMHEPLGMEWKGD